MLICKPHRKIKLLLTSLLLTASQCLTAQTTTTESVSCDQIYCDCASQSSLLLRTSCAEQEIELQKQCQTLGADKAGYCAIYGHTANRPPPSLIPPNAESATSNAIQVILLKLTSARTTVFSSIAKFDESRIAQPELVVVEDLRLVQTNIDKLLALQTELSEVFESHEQPHLKNLSWQQFSELVWAVANSLNQAKPQLAHRTDNVTKELTDIEGSLYETVGFGYGKAELYEKAADMWQAAATIATELSSMSERTGNYESADAYKLLSSTRMHRARDHWNKKAKQ